MANKQQAVEVKQEGDFKIKSKPKKPKQLAIADEEIAKIKIDNRKPEAQGKNPKTVATAKQWLKTYGKPNKK